MKRSSIGGRCDGPKGTTMRSIMKTGLAALASLALVPAAVTAHEVRGTHTGTVTAACKPRRPWAPPT